MLTNSMRATRSRHVGRVLLIGISIMTATIFGCGDAGAATRRPGHVYMMRGVLNVFSLGMDQLADKFHTIGVTATVQNYIGWRGLADNIIALYRGGDREPVILMGHSAGADATIEVARKLQGSGVPVALIVNFDPVSPDPVPPNVKQIVNYYVPAGWGAAVVADKSFTGQLANINESATDNHFSVDKSDSLHRKTIAMVLKVIGGSARRRAPKKSASAKLSDATAR